MSKVFFEHPKDPVWKGHPHLHAFSSLCLVQQSLDVDNPFNEDMHELVCRAFELLEAAAEWEKSHDGTMTVGEASQLDLHMRLLQRGLDPNAD